MSFWLRCKSQRELNVMVCFTPIAAIGCQLITAKFPGSPDGLSLQGCANALTPGILTHSKSMDFGFGQLNAIQAQGRALYFRPNRLNGKPDKANNFICLKRNQQI